MSELGAGGTWCARRGIPSQSQIGSCYESSIKPNCTTTAIWKTTVNIPNRDQNGACFAVEADYIASMGVSMTASEANRQQVLRLLLVEQEQMCTQSKTADNKSPVVQRGRPWKAIIEPSQIENFGNYILHSHRLWHTKCLHTQGQTVTVRQEYDGSHKRGVLNGN
jgi:hypothetical protein